MCHCCVASCGAVEQKASVILRWLKTMKMGEDDPSIEPSSLEYIEDSYLPKMDLNVTPSLDEIPEYDFLKCDDLDLSEIYDENGATHWSEETDLFLRSLTLDQILTIPDDLIEDSSEMQTVETEFAPADESYPPLSNLSRAKRLRNYLSTNKLKFLTRKKMRDVRVTFVDFSKPYLAKISSGDNYKNFLNIHSGTGKRLIASISIIYQRRKRNFQHSLIASLFAEKTAVAAIIRDRNYVRKVFRSTESFFSSF